MTVELLQQVTNKTLEQKAHVKQSLSPLQFCCLVSYMLNDPKNWNRSTRTPLRLQLDFPRHLPKGGHTLSHSCTSRMQKVMYRNSIAVTIVLQDCQATEEMRHKTTYFSNDCFIDLKATTPSQVSLVCLCVTKLYYLFAAVLIHKNTAAKSTKKWGWYIHFWGLGLLLMATVIHLICFKYILPQCLTDCRGIDSLRSRRFTFSEDMLEKEN